MGSSPVGDIMKTMFAEVTTYGTACSETALCEDCFKEENKQKIAKHRKPDVVIDSWTDCTGNEALSCNICGKQ
jgi:hypothetical protein